MNVGNKEQPFFNHSVICEKSKESVGVDSNILTNSTDVVSSFGAKDCIQNAEMGLNSSKIKKESYEDVSKNGIDNIKSSEKVQKVNNSVAHSDSEGQDSDDGWEGNFLSQDDFGRPMFSSISHEQSNHLGSSSDALNENGENCENFPVKVKPHVIEIVPNTSSGDYANCVDNTSPSTLNPSPLNCISIDDPFDPVLITPRDNFLKIPNDRLSNDPVPRDFKVLPVEGHDVCQKLLNNVFGLEHDESLRLLQVHGLESKDPNFKGASSVASPLDSDSGNSAAALDVQLNPQGNGDSCRTLTIATALTVNGVSQHICSPRSDISQSDGALEKCGAPDLHVVTKNCSLSSEFEVSPSCDKTVQNISTNILSDEAVSTHNASSLDGSSVLGHGPSSSDQGKHVPRVTESEKENAQQTKPVANGCSYDKQACLATTQSSNVDRLNKTKMEDISSKLPAIKGRAPRAKKSCVVTSKETKVPDVIFENSEFSVLRQHVGEDSTSIANATEDLTSFTSNSRPALSSMTIKLPELENVLGIGYKSLDKMDAKTLDRIVLAKAQKKQKFELKFPFENSDGPDESPCGRNISDKCRIENLQPLCEKELIGCPEKQNGGPLCENIPKQPLSPVTSSHVGTSCVKTEGDRCLARKNSGPKAAETTFRSTWLSATKGVIKGEKAERKSAVAAEAKLSNQINLNSLSFITSPVFKAKKSQGYAFGHVRRCRDVLNVPSAAFKTSLDAGSASKTSNSSLALERVADQAKHENSAIPNRAKKQAAAYHSSQTSKATAGDKKLCESSNKRLSCKRKEIDRSLSPDSHCRGPKQLILSSAAAESVSASEQRLVKSTVVRLNSKKKIPIDSASVSSSSLPDSVAVKLPRRSADDISLPATPPRSPDGSDMPESETLSLTSSEAHRSATLRCCCEKAFLFDNRHLLLCQGLDSIDGKVVSCSNRWTNGKIGSPATRTPFMALCDKHYELLRSHNCCPGCGLFCVQGEFYQCKQSSRNKLHTFHRHCQVFRDNRSLCPHCGRESTHEISVLQISHSAGTVAKDEAGRGHSNKNSKTARLGVSCTRKNQKIDGSVNEEAVLLGINQTQLELVTATLDPAVKEKLKKIRICPKSFFTACKNGELDRVAYMIGEGIDPNIQPDDCTETYLHVATRHGHKDVVKILLQAGSLPDLVDFRLHTPLMVAAIKGHQKVFKILVLAGASPNYRATDGMTVLHLAAKSGQLDIIRTLIENYRVDVNVKDDGGWTPVIWATEYTHIETVKYLLKMRANPNIQDNELNTGLHWAAYAGSTAISKMFLDAGCDLECSNERGDRPLHIAARQNHYECVSMFLMRGADATAVNRDDQTPIDCCPVKGSSSHLNLTLKKMLLRSPSFHPLQPERLIQDDVSLGRESIPITVVNGFDNAGVPVDFMYVSDYVETIPININRVITSLRACDCKGDCSDINCNCLRSSIKCWYDKTGRLIEEFSYQDPPLLYECNRACRCYASCQNRVIQNGITCRLQVFRTKGRGWGCRTLLNIAKGSFVCEYFGELISDAEADRRLDDSYLFDLDNQEADTFCVDAAKYGNVSRFINHLCEPNITPVKVFVNHQDLRFPRMCFFANRDIKAGEELGFDYGDKFWVIKYKDFTCDCGSSKCRYSVDTIGKTLEDFKRRQDEESGHVTTAG